MLAVAKNYQNMKNSDSMEKHVERKLLIAQLMKWAFDVVPGSKDVLIFKHDIVNCSPLLEDINPFLIAIERVVDELSPNFEIDTSYYFEALEAISVKIDDPRRLNKYIAEKEVELVEIRKETNHRLFILDENANLYLVDSKLPPYPIERGSLRHKLIYYLAKHGGFMSAAQLAKKLDSNPKRIRITVGQLRDQIIKRFNVPGADLIQSKDTGSYQAGTITLRVPKGYTP